MSAYVLTPKARRHLEEIREYLGVAQESIRHREVDRLLATFAQAAQFPFSGRKEPELKRQAVEPRSLLCKPYRVFYYPETFPLAIFAIIHGKRDPVAVLKGR
jgi:plasmid stabilization system protein ParE